MKTKSKKSFDCVEFKRRAQARIYGKIKGLTPQEEIAYFKQAAREGPLGAWWQAAQQRPQVPESRESDARHHED